MNMVQTGDVAALLSGALNVPMVLTGHSLGRNKLEQLDKQGRMSREDINSTYKIMRRIEAEELSLDAAELVITSTRQEIDEQWGLYDGYDVKLERKLRGRMRKGLSCHGSCMPRTAVLLFFFSFSFIFSGFIEYFIRIHILILFALSIFITIFMDKEQILCSSC